MLKPAAPVEIADTDFNWVPVNAAPVAVPMPPKEIPEPTEFWPTTMGATHNGLISAKRITANVLKECKEMLANTTSDLEQHLQKMDNRLQNKKLGSGVKTPVSESGFKRKRKASNNALLSVPKPLTRWIKTISTSSKMSPRHKMLIR